LFVGLIVFPILALGINFQEYAKVSPKAGGLAGWSSPAVGDINNDGDVDAVMSTPGGTVVAVSSSGATLWRTKIPRIDCPDAPSSDRVYSTPAIGSLSGDGRQQVVLGYGGFKGKDCEGGVVAFHGDTGEVAWNFRISRWSRNKKVWVYRNSVVSTPLIQDLDGDGYQEVVFGSWSRYVYVLNHLGKVNLAVHTADTVWSSPIVLNTAPRKTIVIGSDISRNDALKTKDGGNLFFIDPLSSRSLIGFPDSTRVLKTVYLDQVLFSSPVVADVDPNSTGDEVIIGSGCYFKGKGSWVKVVSATTGKVLHTLPVARCSASTPAVGDLNGDGVKDIVSWVSTGNDGRAIAYSLASGVPEVLWEKSVDKPVAFQSPVVLEGTKPIVLLGASKFVEIINGETGQTIDTLSTGVFGFGNIVATDFNKDGIPDLVVGGTSRTRGEGGIIKFFLGMSNESFENSERRNWRG
jgi:hypothetical protein